MIAYPVQGALCQKSQQMTVRGRVKRTNLWVNKPSPILWLVAVRKSRVKELDRFLKRAPRSAKDVVIGSSLRSMYGRLSFVVRSYLLTPQPGFTLSKYLLTPVEVCFRERVKPLGGFEVGLEGVRGSVDGKFRGLVQEEWILHWKCS